MRIFKILIGTLIAILLVVTVCYFYLAKRIGEKPADADIKQYDRLTYFSNGEFVSPRSIDYFPEKISGGESGFKRFFFRSRYAPIAGLEKIVMDENAFNGKTEDFALYWLGHASAILELDGKRIVIDPVFENAAPIPFVAERYEESPLKRSDLRNVQYVLITHNHYDHLEYKTMRYLRHEDAQFIVPLGVGAILKGWGVEPHRIHELAWGDSYVHDGLRFTAEEAVHYSGRGKSDKNKSLWASYIIQAGDKNIFWSGDTGYGQHFSRIGKQYGPFDFAALEIDGWNPGWPATHLFPDEVIKASLELRSKAVFPIHWGVFDLALHPWDESINRVVELAEIVDMPMITPMMGEKINPREAQTSYWWQNEPDTGKKR